MQKFASIVPRWLPAVLVMLVIFIFSSQPDTSMPHYGVWDDLVKKSAHVFGYALLCLSFLYWFGFKRFRYVWLLTLIYAMTDEFHQSFVPGRHPSIWDVLIFDNLGALIMLGLMGQFRGRNEAA